MTYSAADIERKIKAFNTIEDIISAMRAYAGATVRKTEEVVRNIREREEHIFRLLSDLTTHYPYTLPGGMARDNQGKRLVVVFGSAQGFCGTFNEGIVNHLSDIVGREDVLFVVGDRLKNLIKAAGIAFHGYIDSPVSLSGIKPHCQKILSMVMEVYGKDDYNSLIFVFTSITGNSATITAEKILPPDWEKIQGMKPGAARPLTYLEPPMLLARLLEELVWIKLNRGFTESLRSENWYRLRSMENASENLKRRLSDLDARQKYVRQEEITEEILEILGSGMFYGKGGAMKSP